MVTAAAVGEYEVDLSWAPAADNMGVTGYGIYRNGTLVATAAGVSYADTGLADGRDDTYGVDAFDSAGNRSALSGSAAATTPDVTPPSTPAGLSAVSVGASAIGVSWQPSTDDVGVAGYTVYRDGAAIATVAAPATV